MSDTQKLSAVALIGVLFVFLLAISDAGNRGTVKMGLEVPFQGYYGIAQSRLIPDADGLYHPLPFTGEDLYFVTQALYYEAQDQPTECQEDLVQVIMARKFSEKYPSTIKDVVWDSYQFSYTHDGKHEKMNDKDIRDKLRTVAIRVLGGNVVDKTQASMYYFNPDLADPSWQYDFRFVNKCGDHAFYTNKYGKDF